MLRKRWFRITLVAAVVSASVALTAWSFNAPFARVLGRTQAADGSGSVELISDVYRLDRVYRSMTGPRSNQPQIRLSSAAPNATLWLTGIDTEVVSATDFAPLSPEYFCHSNLTLNPETSSPAAHNGSFAAPLHADWRFFTLVPGRMSLHLPPGFGVPVKNGTLLDNFSMALNQNPGHPDQNIRLRTRVYYRGEQPGEPPPQSLFRRALYVYQQHVPQPRAVAAPAATAVHQGAQCAESCERDLRGQRPSSFYAGHFRPLQDHPGATCCVENASVEGIVNQFGAENTVHWMVPPGVHVYRSEVTQQFHLPADTRVHYVTGHLHPYGKSLTLRALDTGETVFTIEARSRRDELGVEWISEVSSVEGVPVQAQRRYELVAEYENRTPAPIDAMAILYLYLAEPGSSPRTSAAAP